MKRISEQNTRITAVKTQATLLMSAFIYTDRRGIRVSFDSQAIELPTFSSYEDAITAVNQLGYVVDERLTR